MELKEIGPRGERFPRAPLNQPLIAVADPGFPDGGANFEGDREKLLFGQFFPKNYMKMKEIGPRKGCTWIHKWIAHKILKVTISTKFARNHLDK